MNNESGIVKAKIDSKLYDVLKIILTKRDMTQKDLVESSIKKFVIENINLLVDDKK